MTEQEVKELRGVVATLRHSYMVTADRLVEAEAEFKAGDLAYDTCRCGKHTGAGERHVQYSEIEMIRLRRATKHDQGLISAAIVAIELMIQRADTAHQHDWQKDGGFSCSCGKARGTHHE